MDHDSPIQKTQDGATLRLEWHNRYVRKDNFTCCFFVCFWIIWAPVTLYVAYLILTDTGPLCFLLIWSVFGWLGTLLIPYTLWGRSWSEWIEVSAQTVSHGHEGFLAPKPKTFPLTKILCIFSDTMAKTVPCHLVFSESPAGSALRTGTCLDIGSLRI
jgi:hypothetical protein